VTEQERPVKELRFLLFLAQPEIANHVYYAEFLFPLMIFEGQKQIPLLIPEPACEQIVADWPEMLKRLETECAVVDVPYHPEPEQDEAGYIFSVMVAYLDSDTPALAEALMLQKYAPRLWERYRHLAHDFNLNI
jgi:hypothetical protein